jgi:hypothetical protein
MHHSDRCARARRGRSVLLHDVGAPSPPSGLGRPSQGTGLALALALLGSLGQAARQAEMGRMSKNRPSTKIRFSNPFFISRSFQILSKLQKFIVNSYLVQKS